MDKIKNTGLMLLLSGFLILSIYYFYYFFIGFVDVLFDANLPVVVRIGIFAILFGLLIIMIYLVGERVKDSRKDSELFLKKD